MSNANRSGVPYLLVVILLLIALAGGAAGGILGYLWITGGSGEASLSVQDKLATLEASDDVLEAAVGTAVFDAANSVIADAVAAAVAEAVDASVSAAMETAVAVSEPVEFAIVSAESLASFTLEEDLRGVRTTVVGATNEVGGSILVDLADPSASTIGAIVINARTLETDNSMRNRALRSRILQSARDEYEYVIFEPRELSNWSASAVTIGDTLTFDISGDLTVVDTTRSVTFAASVTLESDTRIRGRAEVNLLHADFGLVIPDVPSVANVTDDVTLRLEFVAQADG